MSVMQISDEHRPRQRSLLTLMSATIAMAIIGLPLLRPACAQPRQACKVVVSERDSGWPVPLVELRTTHHSRYVSDNAGVIAIDDPSLMNREVWFHVLGQGYEVPADGFGNRGVRLTPVPDATLHVEVVRTSIAKRIGRLTGGGLFAESQQLGEQLQWSDGPVLGCDSLQLARHQGRAIWAWGDTTLADYPLGVFHMTGASTPLAAFEQLQPPLKPHFEYFVDDRARPRGLAPMPGSGPTWLTGFVSVSDAAGKAHLVALYRKIKPPLSVYEIGQCVWDETRQIFEQRLPLWQIPPETTNTDAKNTVTTNAETAPAILAEGHPSWWRDANGKQWLLFGNPFPHARLPATYEAWCEISEWQKLEPQSQLVTRDGAVIEPHSGSIAFNAFRQRWVTVFVQKFGQASFLGTVWYAEADSPLGPWGPAVKILEHVDYSFYNPRLHPELESEDARVLLFEGTYSATFAKQAQPTPRWDYNQVLYRLDLDDPRLQAAQHNAANCKITIPPCEDRPPG